MNGLGLRTDQAPPLFDVFRFFLTAPVFGTAGALLLLIAPHGLADRWSPALLAATHLLTLGFLTMVMCGALLQMLPVLAGSPVRRSGAVATAVHLLLAAGTLALVASFLAPLPLLRYAALGALAAAFGVFLVAAGASLWRAPRNPSVDAMRGALAALVVTVALGLALASGRAPRLLPAMPGPADLHIAWGLGGWVALLILGVAYQVVPMFQLTRPYPSPLHRGLLPGLFVGLGVLSAAVLAPAAVPRWVAPLAVAPLAVFAAATLWLQTTRRRRLPDAHVRFWALGLVSLLGALAAAAAAAAGAPFADRLGALAVAWMTVGFGVSVVVAMLYKIVPFLVWLHLQARKVPQLPNMKHIVPDARALAHFWVHAGAVILLAPASFAPAWLDPAALLLLASFVWLGWNVTVATLLYQRLARAPVLGVQTG
jgi:hypothetical protein